MPPPNRESRRRADPGVGATRRSPRRARPGRDVVDPGRIAQRGDLAATRAGRLTAVTLEDRASRTSQGRGATRARDRRLATRCRSRPSEAGCILSPRRSTSHCCGGTRNRRRQPWWQRSPVHRRLAHHMDRPRGTPRLALECRRGDRSPGRAGDRDVPRSSPVAVAGAGAGPGIGVEWAAPGIGVRTRTRCGCASHDRAHRLQRRQRTAPPDRCPHPKPRAHTIR